MLRQAKALERTPNQIASARAQEVKSTYSPCYSWEDDQELEDIRDETFTIIRLLSTESPTFSSE